MPYSKTQNSTKMLEKQLIIEQNEVLRLQREIERLENDKLELKADNNRLRLALAAKS